MYKFKAASKKELIVFGSARPGYTNKQVNRWIEFMESQGVQCICCLLTEIQLARYSDLLSTYKKVFGDDQVCWAPIEDFKYAEPDYFIHKILPFLATANQKNMKVVVHCSGGIGRTGHILTAWLVAARGFSSKEAITAVQKSERNPHEAVIAAVLRGHNPWVISAKLNALLDECNRVRNNSI